MILLFRELSPKKGNFSAPFSVINPAGIPGSILFQETLLKRRLIALLFVMLLAACAPLTPAAQPADTATPIAPAPTAAPPSPTPMPMPMLTPTPLGVTLEQLKNATYTLMAINNVPVKLTDGKFHFSDPTNLIDAVGQLIEPAAFGDLNGDGLIDAAVTIATNTGGSGTFHELIVVLAQKGQAADLLIGDRIQEKQLTILDGKIILDYLRQGPKDGLCCPSEHAQTTYQLQNGKLAVVSDQVIP
jgi:hypothetical protein